MTLPNSTEAALRQSVPVFVNSFNQFTYLRDTVNWLHDQGFGNISVLDNASKYEPLLAYFETDDFKSRATLVPLGDNIGPRRSLMMAQKSIEPNAPFIFTDPDFLLPSPPDPLFLMKMFEWGRRFEKVKVGLALDISEDQDFKDIRLSAAFNNRTIREWERKFWRNALEEDVYAAAVDLFPACARGRPCDQGACRIWQTPSAYPCATDRRAGVHRQASPLVHR